MPLHPAVEERLARLAPDQRSAATAPPGPILCVAPAGSGKTTTLVARIAWLIDTGSRPDQICAVTFNKRAADELEGRLTAALAPLGVETGAVRVRTFHALGREILRSAAEPVEPLLDRGAILRQLYPMADRVRLRQLDDRLSRLKLDRGLSREEVGGDPAAVEDGEAFVAYEAALRERGGLDFDDLVVRAVRLVETSAVVGEQWRLACAHLLVDEVQDVDRTQLRLALQLAQPLNRIFLVGDDDQSIYGWRLADVRRVLALGDVLPGLQRIDLVTNYRCPGPVVRRAVRLIERNEERFHKAIQAGPRAEGFLALAPDGGDGETALRRFLGAPLPAGSTRAVLARTNRELMLPLALALDLDLPVRATAGLLLEASGLDVLLAEIADADTGTALLPVLAAVRERHEAPPSDGWQDDEPAQHEVAVALLAWAARHPRDDVPAFVARIRDARDRLAGLRRDDASLILATAHGTKGLEFDEVAVIGMDEGRFPSARTLADAEDPDRALEEERRLAYVAWTRAKRQLTLVYDPLRPSPFLLEAFSADEMNLPDHGGRAPEPGHPAARARPVSRQPPRGGPAPSAGGRSPPAAAP